MRKGNFNLQEIGWDSKRASEKKIVGVQTESSTGIRLHGCDSADGDGGKGDIGKSNTDEGGNDDDGNDGSEMCDGIEV